MLIDAASPPSIPTVTLPPGAPWGVYALSIAAPVVVYVLWLFRHSIARLGEREPLLKADPCVDCAAARAEVVASRAESAAALQKLHAAARQIADLQHADSKVLEGIADTLKEQGRVVGEIKTTVTLIDRDSFRREPTR